MLTVSMSNIQPRQRAAHDGWQQVTAKAGGQLASSLALPHHPVLCTMSQEGNI